MNIEVKTAFYKSKFHTGSLPSLIIIIIICCVTVAGLIIDVFHAKSSTALSYSH